MRYDYDLIILGGGSAGIVAGVMAGNLGLRVLLIEKYRMGGECLNTGCVPSKALLHAAGVARTLRSEAGIVGLPTRPISREDARPVLAWVRGIVGAVQDADATEKLLLDNGVTILRGDAVFLDANTVSLTADGATRAVTAQHFLLATGSRPAIPEGIPGLSETGYLTNQTIFDLEEIPERLLILGGGPIGVEMAQAFARLGSRVTLVQTGVRLLPRDDAELAGLLTESLRAEGIDVRLSARVETIELGSVAVVRDDAGARERIGFDRILVAVGRAPNVEGLSLDAAGVRMGNEGIAVDSHLRTSAENILACGDVCDDGYRFSHMAEYQAKIAVRNIVFPGDGATDYRNAPWATFTDPELAHVGMTEEEAQARELGYDVYRQPFAQNDRALTEGVGAAPGMVKLIVESGVSGRILGAQILGPRAGELIQEWVVAMEKGLSIRAIADSVHVYPTLSMASQHAAQRWYERQSQAPVVRGALDTYVKHIRPHERLLAAGVLGAAVLGVGLATAARVRARQTKNGSD